MAVKMVTLPEPESRTTVRNRPTQKRCFCHGAICRTIKALVIQRCLYGSEMVLLGVVIRKYETPTTNILKKMVMAYSRLHVKLWLTTRDKQQTYLKLKTEQLIKANSKVHPKLLCQLLNTTSFNKSHILMH